MAVRTLPGHEWHLIKRCIDRDRQAQRQLYEQLAPALMALCMRYLRNRQEAEDSLSNSMVKIFQHIDTYSGNGSFEGWAKRIAARECLNQLRKYQPDFASVTEDVNALPLAVHTDPMEEEVLQHLVENLPSGYRTVFNLHALEGYSHEEIAKELGIAESTSRSQLAKARKLLQEQLAKHENDQRNGRASY